MKRFLLLAGALALLLSACELRAEISIRENGSGSLSFVVGLPKGFAGLAGSDPAADIRAKAKDAPFDVRVENYSTDRVEGVRMSIPFSSVDDLKEKIQKAQELRLFQQGGAALGDQSLGGQDPSASLGSLVIERSGPGWRFSMPTGFGGTDAGAAGKGFEEFAKGLLELIDIQFRVTLPGPPGENNATSVEEKCDGSTFVWKVTADAAQGGGLNAETSGPGGSCFPVVPLAAGVGGAIVVGVLSWVLLGRRGGGEPAPVMEGPGIPPAAPTPGAGPMPPAPPPVPPPAPPAPPPAPSPPPAQG